MTSAVTSPHLTPPSTTYYVSRSSVPISRAETSDQYNAELMHWAGDNPDRQAIAEEVIGQGGFRAKLLQIEAPSDDFIEDMPLPPQLDTLAVDHPSENVSDAHDLLQAIFQALLKSTVPNHQVSINLHFPAAIEVLLLQSALSRALAYLTLHQQNRFPVTATAGGHDVYRSGRSDNPAPSAPPAQPESIPTPPVVRATAESADYRAIQNSATVTTPIAADNSANTSLRKMAFEDEINAGLTALANLDGGPKIGGHPLGMTCPVTLDDFDPADKNREWGILETQGHFTVIDGKAIDGLIANNSNHPFIPGKKLEAADIYRGKAADELLKAAMLVASNGTSAAAVSTGTTAATGTVAASTEAITKAIAAAAGKPGGFQIGGKQIELECLFSQDDFDPNDKATKWSLVVTGPQYHLIKDEYVADMLANGAAHPLLADTPATSGHFIRGQAFLNLIAAQTGQTTAAAAPISQANSDMAAVVVPGQPAPSGLQPETVSDPMAAQLAEWVAIRNGST